MVHTLIKSQKSVTLVGGGELNQTDLLECLKSSDRLVAVDGGAENVMALGHEPDLTIGDLDSLTDKTRQQLAADKIAHIAEQDSTDFAKALIRVDAPLLYGLGFTGGRIDHELAVYAALSRFSEKRCIIIGAEDICVHAPCDIVIDLPVGTRLSLFPMGPVSGTSKGLKWEIDGLAFAPRGQIGTSNETREARVSLHFDGPGMLLIMPKAHLGALETALLANP